MYIKDDSRELSILVDRSVGGSSIKDGQLELMLHRLISSICVTYSFILLYILQCVRMSVDGNHGNFSVHKILNL